MKNPLVCIIMATYNGEKYLAEQLDSIINQTYKNWILFISDDDSKDSTKDIIKEYQKKYGKSKIIVTNNNSNSHGAIHNFANAFELAPKADLYMFSDQDDFWMEDKIKNMVRRILKEEENIPILEFCDAKIVDQNLNTKFESLTRKENRILPNEKYMLNHFLVDNYIYGCTMIFNHKLREITKKIYLESYMHDYWIALVAARTGKIIYLDEALHLYRQHENNVCGARAENMGFCKNFFRPFKIFRIHKLISKWHTWQKCVLIQAKEIQKQFNDSSKNSKVVNNFIAAMESKSSIKCLFALIKGHHWPIEKISIIKLSWK